MANESPPKEKRPRSRDAARAVPSGKWLRAAEGSTEPLRGSYLFEFKKRVIHCGGSLSAKARLVGLILADHMFTRPEARPSVLRLARLAHLSERTARDALCELKEAGLFAIIPGGVRGARRSNVYRMDLSDPGNSCRGGALCECDRPRQETLHETPQPRQDLQATPAQVADESPLKLHTDGAGTRARAIAQVREEWLLRFSFAPHWLGDDVRHLLDRGHSPEEIAAAVRAFADSKPENVSSLQFVRNFTVWLRKADEKKRERARDRASYNAGERHEGSSDAWVLRLLTEPSPSTIAASTPNTEP